MKKNFISILTMVFALCTSLAANASQYSALYVFGDSLSDNGNITDPTYRPTSPYANGLFSNGPVAAQYLATSLGVPLFDFAVGGATTGAGNPDVLSMPNSGVLSQVNAFAGAHLSGVDQNALYMIWAGPNDFLNSLNPIATIQDAVLNILTEIGILNSLGAQRFLVPNMVDLGATPRGSQLPGASAISAAFNSALSAALPSDVTQFDTFGLLNDVVANPGSYGFSNVTDPCFDGVTVCADPSQYLFWDDLHPTTAAHQILAAEFASAVPEPATTALLGVALFVMAAFGSVKTQRRFQ
jgi:phospholipase/lecithinase/hemolysin